MASTEIASFFHCCGNKLNKQTVLPIAKHGETEIDSCDSDRIQCVHIMPTYIKQSYMQHSCINVTIDPDNRLIWNSIQHNVKTKNLKSSDADGKILINIKFRLLLSI